MARVLVIDDEPEIRKLLDVGMRAAGHECQEAATGMEGIQLGRKWQPDVILLDLMLPDIDGKEVCRRMKSDLRTREIPIIMVTGRSEEVDRVVGFELGAEDYVVKPFSVRELLLRIQRSLARRVLVSGPTQVGGAFGSLCIDWSTQRASVGDVAIPLTPIELRLLAVLLQGRGRVVPRQTLRDQAWGPEVPVSPRALDTQVKRLRRRLGPAGGCIETVRGVGFRFSANGWANGPSGS
jgi:two-component system, OmpR family, phosphate regulon response regulator PhoB